MYVAAFAGAPSPLIVARMNRFPEMRLGPQRQRRSVPCLPTELANIHKSCVFECDICIQHGAARRRAI